MNCIGRLLNSLFILIVCGILLAAFGYQIITHDEPCPLCLLQRLGMIGVALGAAFNLKFGIRPIHYGFSLLSALFGGGVALRQITLHVCPGFPIFGTPVLGLSLYTWSFLTFVCSTAAISLLLFIYEPEHHYSNSHPLKFIEKLALALLFIVIFANVITTFVECGFGPCQA